MSLLIKGMEMPTACRHGECNFACSAAYKTGLICIARKQYVVPGDVPGECHCFLVPPHGRLIDADALREEVKKHATPSDAWVFSLIRTAPTIIEAEEAEI